MIKGETFFRPKKGPETFFRKRFRGKIFFQLNSQLLTVDNRGKSWYEIFPQQLILVNTYTARIHSVVSQASTVFPRIPEHTTKAI